MSESVSPQNTTATTTTTTTVIFDTIIIGAGPAGLVAANALHQLQRGQPIRFCLLERGLPLEKRDRWNEEDLGSGAGGAGLFSDGKFSFWPSGTNVWSLRDVDRSYRLVRSHLLSCELDAPDYSTSPFPSSSSSFSSSTDCSTTTTLSLEERSFGISASSSSDSFESGSSDEKSVWIYKEYPSLYMSLDNRMALVKHLSAGMEDRIFYQVEVTDLQYDEEAKLVRLSCSDGQTRVCRTVICCGGRLSAGRSWLRRVTTNTKRQDSAVFRRVEFGVRLQGSASLPVWSDWHGVDPKWIGTSTSNAAVSWRTFCCCRRGIVIRGHCDGFHVYSGRADDEPSQLSNIGFNLRITDPHLFDELSGGRDEFVWPGTGTTHQLHLPMDQFLSSTEGDAKETFGRFLPLLQEGVRQLIEKFPSLAGCDVIGPTVEGIGWYPSIDAELRLQGCAAPIWIGGDAGGRFRGIVAAMISGATAAFSVARTLAAAADTDTAA